MYVVLLEHGAAAHEIGEGAQDRAHLIDGRGLAAHRDLSVAVGELDRIAALHQSQVGVVSPEKGERVEIFNGYGACRFARLGAHRGISISCPG